MLISKLCFCLSALSSLVVPSAAVALGPNSNVQIKSHKRELLQDLVTWDEQSLFVKGERVLFLSGEFHPFRLPVPGLWLDVLQKVKALGLNGISFYIDWNLVEGKPGDFSAEGIFDLGPFFDAAKEAGIWLLARPGPYINAEVSGGGYPGWLQRTQGRLRTPDEEYINATKLYSSKIGKIIADAQITNGGPVVLFQPENEYTQAAPGIKFPDGDYMQMVEDLFHDAGIVVPFISNDAKPVGHNAPGNGTGQVDIYGHDAYPLGFDCANPYTWPQKALPDNWTTLHDMQSPKTPYSLVEFQGGSFDPWGGLGFDQCSQLLNAEFERVFYKNDMSFGVRIFNFYMIFGGTNWGNLGHQGGYTSYDYGSVITEERLVGREKYSELKLEANFLRASPAYLTATPQNLSITEFTNTTDLTVTPLQGNKTNFYVVRHTDYSTHNLTSYVLKVPTSAGNLTVPQFDGPLTLDGRDSKIHVTDYDVGGTTLVYSTAEIFTWKSYGDKTVLVVYGAGDEYHEMALATSDSAKIVEGDSATIVAQKDMTIVNWKTSPTRRILQVGNGLTVYILDRNTAYNYWVLDLPGDDTNGNYSTQQSVIVKAGYLLRTAAVDGATLQLTGDLNSTTAFEVIGAPKDVTGISFNGKTVDCKADANGIVSGTVEYSAPELSIPDLDKLDWKYADSLPEIKSTYDDSKWTAADHTTTRNPRNLTTPTSLYGSDYGFNTGVMVYRGRFVAEGSESTFFIRAIGGAAFGTSVWLNSTLIGSAPGSDVNTDTNNTFTLPNLQKGQPAILTVLVDNMGFDENQEAGGDEMKTPRGILSYHLKNRDDSAITWKIQGNLGGEDYQDRTRGPLNEGGLYAERQGWHLPGAPTDNNVAFTSSKPTDGIKTAGVAFYTAQVPLDLPHGYDVPLALVFSNSSGLTTTSNTSTDHAVSNYRVQLFVNGYQYGKYVNNIGPQTVFPVPPGIINPNGDNTLALTLWAQDAQGAKLEGLKLLTTAQVGGSAALGALNGAGNSSMPTSKAFDGDAQAPGGGDQAAAILSSYGDVPLAPMPGWTSRNNP